MRGIRNFMRRAFTPITIMLIPHSNAKPLGIKVPSIGIALSAVMWLIGTVYVMNIAVDSLEYNRMRARLNYYSGQFLELRSTILTLKKAEEEFRGLFGVKSKKEVLERIDTSGSGSIDIENLKLQIKSTMETVGEIKDYLSQQRDMYRSTPRGWPVSGHITSGYGYREHPLSGQREFHGGLDIAAEPGRPVRATADGIVSFAGWSGNNGNLVVVEHGFGFSSFYGHNKAVEVRTGQKVARGDVIGYIGSTGSSTGPHVHYEVWLKGRCVNPNDYLKEKS